MNDNLLNRLYQLLLRLYPASFSEQLGEEMVTVFAEAVAEAQRASQWAVARVVLRELAYFPANLLEAYTHSWQQLQPALVKAPKLPWVAGWTLLSGAMLPLAWFLTAPLSLLFLLLLDLLPGPAIGATTASTLGLVTALGLLTAFMQWFLLRSHLPGAGWWIPLTLAGWLVAGLLTLLTSQFVFLGRLVPGIVFIIVGVCVGLAQWLLLRRLLPHSSWWVPVNLLATGIVLLGGETFESITESLAFLGLPYLLTGAFLWLLLQWAPAHTPLVEAPAKLRLPAQRRNWPIYVVLVLLLVIVAGPWSYAVGHLELAKRQGIYASPEAAIIIRSAAVEGVEVERIQMVVDNPVQSMSHVHFAGANVIYDRPHPSTGRHRVSYGSYYIQVEGGWVQVGEGAFPTLIGK
ncbi:MAG: hypothetical protein R6X32_12720, partial [Chloroflexota bacterium]